MPNWNLADDWPEGYKPKYEVEGYKEEDWPPDILFYPPLPPYPSRLPPALPPDSHPPNLDDLNNYKVSLEEDSNGVKKLVIDITSPAKIEVLAMVPPDIIKSRETGIEDPDDSNSKIYKIELETSVFTIKEFIFTLLKYGPSNIPSPMKWFDNWLSATARVPHKIIYENIKNKTDNAKKTGDKIGEAAKHPSDDNKKQIKISIQYGRIEKKDDIEEVLEEVPKFMHPREFFSLLFWRKECDPLLFNASPDPYWHPLLNKMMDSKEDGTAGTYRDDTWLGLRPPLRTYKRVEWEAKRAHTLYHNNWQKNKPLFNGTKCLIQNEYIKAERIGKRCEKGFSYITKKCVKGTTKKDPLCDPNENTKYYCGWSKCNILVGEMAFRAGFKVPVRIVGSRLKYITDRMVKPCTSANCDGKNVPPIGEKKESDGTKIYQTITHDGKIYQLSKFYGKRRYVTSANFADINKEINKKGKVIIFARRPYATRAFHVVILSSISGIHIHRNKISGNIIDQHCSSSDTPRFCDTANYLGFLNQDERAFIELIPGGDPTEEWGILDLNCLEEVT